MEAKMEMCVSCCQILAFSSLKYSQGLSSPFLRKVSFSSKYWRGDTSFPPYFTFLSADRGGDFPINFSIYRNPKKYYVIYEGPLITTFIVHHVMNMPENASNLIPILVFSRALTLFSQERDFHLKILTGETTISHLSKKNIPHSSNSA